MYLMFFGILVGRCGSVVVRETDKDTKGAGSTLGCDFRFYYASVKSSCASLPRADPRAFAFFFSLDGKFPGVGTLELSNPPGWGRKKRANAPSFVNTPTFFIDLTVEKCPFKHFNVQFFVSINVFLCNRARILMKTSRRNEMH